MTGEQVLFGDRTQRSDRDALALAWKALGEMDPRDIVRGALAEWDEGKGALTVPVIHRRATAMLGEAKVVWENGEQVFPPVHILVLHYLARSREMEPSGDLIGFRELEGGSVYFSAFEAQSVKNVTRTFGPDPKSLLSAGNALGATPFTLGHASIRLPVFPRVPVYIVVWAGDDEVPASSNFLFDRTIRDILHTEDIAVLCSVLASMLRKALGQARPPT
jgi:hypothetical protein